MRAFVISLPDAFERRAFMKKQLDRLGLAYEFFDAILGRERIGSPHWYDAAGALRCEGRGLGPGEVGCALSHAAVYEQIVRRQLPWTLVLEDDAILHEDLPAILEQLESGMMQQGDLVFLERCDFLWPGSGRKLFGGYRIGDPLLVRAGSAAQTAGYVITRSAAEAIRMANVPVRFPADSWGHYKGLVRFRGVQPTLTLIRQESSFGSTIVEGKHRRPFTRNSLTGLIAHDFLTYTSLGRMLQHPLRALVRRFRASRG